MAASDVNTLPSHSYDGNPKRTPFFNGRNSKQMRKTDMELKVDFGANHPLNQTIKHLFLRSKTVEVDASGQPIFEVFEFIAQDVDESDNKFV